MAAEAGSGAASLRHCALFYRGSGQYTDVVGGFVRAGLAAGERVLVAVPGDKLAGLRGTLGSQRDLVEFADMTSLGTNPACIIPAIQAFAAAGRRPVRFAGEPVWPGRSAAEIGEATRHEALINLAFAGTGTPILCPYDAARLSAQVLADACRTHPEISSGSSEEPSRAYAGPGSVPASCTRPLPPPPADAAMFGYDADLRGVRRFVADRARVADLPAARAADLVLAVNEIAANTLRHSGGDGTVLLWRAAGELICELRDAGHITDPLAGRRLPAPDQVGGHGLWLVNRSVDLTEVRTGRSGTVTRLHMRLRQNPPAAPAGYQPGNGRDDGGGGDAGRAQLLRRRG